MISTPAGRPDRTLLRSAAALLLAQFVLMWAAFFVLSAAVGWPASLDLPAAEKLALFAAHERASLLGYALYAGSAALLVPIAVVLRRALWGGAGGRPTRAAVFGDLSAALGVSAGLVKVVALSRWLLLAPVLAAATVGASPDAQATTDAVFGALDALGGGVGEVLGVGLLSGAWTAALAGGLWAARGGRALAVAGLASAALLLLSVPAGFGLDLGPVLTVSGIAWQLWLAALAVWLVRSHRPGSVAPGRADDEGPRRAASGLRPAVLAAAAVVGVLAVPTADAQAPVRGTVAEVGIGLGKSEFYGRLEDAEEARRARVQPQPRRHALARVLPARGVGLGPALARGPVQDPRRHADLRRRAGGVLLQPLLRRGLGARLPALGPPGRAVRPGRPHVRPVHREDPRRRGRPGRPPVRRRAGRARGRRVRGPRGR